MIKIIIRNRANKILAKGSDENRQFTLTGNVFSSNSFSGAVCIREGVADSITFVSDKKTLLTLKISEVKSPKTLLAHELKNRFLLNTTQFNKGDIITIKLAIQVGGE